MLSIEMGSFDIGYAEVQERGTARDGGEALLPDLGGPDLAEAARPDQVGHEEAGGMIKRLLNWWRRREREAMRKVVAQGWRDAWDEELLRHIRLRYPELRK